MLQTNETNYGKKIKGATNIWKKKLIRATANAGNKDHSLNKKCVKYLQNLKKVYFSTQKNVSSLS